MDDEWRDERTGCDEETRRCEDCDVLLEALRDAEQQCREFEDAGARVAERSWAAGFSDELLQEENDRLARLRKLERRRDCALDVLLKHQRLDHSGS